MSSGSVSDSRHSVAPSRSRSRVGRQIHVLVLPHVHAMDLAGPVQVFYEANSFGAAYDLLFCGPCSRIETAQGFSIADLGSLPVVQAEDWVLVPGIDSKTLSELSHIPVEWLRSAADAGARICSICSGAWLLAHAGILNNRRCTTHWKIADAMAQRFPELRVLKDRLFVRDGPVVTSAGVASGIDLALAVVEEDHGPLVAARVAREMVVYLRRDGGSGQRSVFVEYRTHLHAGVHRVQDWLIAHPERRSTLEELAKLAGMSSRHLTRVFKRATGVSVKHFVTELKVEVAANLLRDPSLTVEAVASKCGFADARQLRRLWLSNFGVGPAVWREEAGTLGDDRGSLYSAPRSTKARDHHRVRAHRHDSQSLGTSSVGVDRVAPQGFDRR